MRHILMPALLSVLASSLFWNPSAQSEPLPEPVYQLTAPQFVLSYQDQVALARDWANAFRKIAVYPVEIRVRNPQASGPNTSVYSKVTKVTEVGALLLIEYTQSYSATKNAIVRADQILEVIPMN